MADTKVLRSSKGKVEAELKIIPSENGVWSLVKKDKQVQQYKRFKSYGIKKEHLDMCELVYLDSKEVGRVYATKKEILDMNWQLDYREPPSTVAEHQYHLPITSWHKFTTVEDALAHLRAET